MEKNDNLFKLNIDLVDGTTKLNWEAIANATRYELWCSADFIEYKMIFYGQDLCFIHYSATPDVNYSYYIRALDAYGNKLSESNRVSGKSGLSRPRVSGTINRKGIVNLSWTPVTGAKRYIIYRAHGTAKPKKYATTKLFDYEDSSCTIGAEYKYSIVAEGGIGKKSLPSKEITLVGSYKATPLKLAISKNGFPLVTWKNPEGAIACHIYRTEDPNIEPQEIACKKDETSYINTTAKKGKTYYYSIRMEYEGGVLSLASKLKEIRRPEHLEDSLEIVADVNKEGKLRISWNALEDAVLYQVFASYKYSNHNYEKIFETENNLYINSAYKFDVVRYYRIRAIHKDGLKGKMSKIIKVDPANIKNNK